MKRLIFIAFAGFFLFSCKINDSDSDLDLNYGSIKGSVQLKNENSSENSADSADSVKKSSRAVYYDEITNATVTVSGYGMEDIVKNVTVDSSGKGTFSIDGIPSGKNRVVSVQALYSLGNVLSKIDGMVIRERIDINPGSDTSVNVNWKSTATGSVYYNLIKAKKDVSNIEESFVSSLILSGKHSALINTVQIAADIKGNTAESKSAEEYVLSPASVTFSTTKAYSDIKVQVCDPVSSVVEGTTGSTQKIENIAPGTWNFYIIKDNSIIYSQKITLESSKVVDLGAINLENEIGFNHPESGSYSPVEQEKWSSADYALGAAIDSDGNGTFAVYSKNAEKILLEIYKNAYGEQAAYDYWLEKGSDNVWRAKISGIENTTLYAFRAWGPNWTFSGNWTRGGSSEGFVSDVDSYGNRFNPNKVLFDPYAKEISHDKSNPLALGSETADIYSTGETLYGTLKHREVDTALVAPKSVLIKDSTDFGTKPKIAAKDATIYEAHARGITRHSSSASLSSILSGISGFESVQDVPEDLQGTYAGAVYLIPYLKALGINTIELLPVHESDNDANPDSAPGGNFWAYMTYGYFAPDRRYSSDKTLGGPTREFKQMVKAFHEAGMEVYLDVVYNHSGEGGTYNGSKDNYAQAELTFMRGLDNSTYYSLVSGTPGSYWETTGCGNNLQCDNQVVRTFILDSLKYWITEMGVDGFRFDLATVLGREKDSSGNWEYNASSQTLKEIVSLGNEYDVEMIAESWDTGSNSYQVGNFPEGWGGWNGRYRDEIRNFVGKGSRGSVNDYINGDYYYFNKEGGPHKSVNFIVAHDGFTLADLCSCEGNGNAQNTLLTWPFGPSDGGNSDYNTLGFGTAAENKRQAARNYIAIQMISRGVPMIVYGDELSRTQNGNNNPYNIDSVATWNNYNMINTSSPHKVSTGGAGTYHNNFGTFGNSNNVNGNFMFMNYMLKLRENEPALRQANYDVSYDFKKENGTSALADDDRCVWLKINGSSVAGGSDYLVFMNMYTKQVDYTIPAPSTGAKWTRIVDTSNWAETSYNCWSDSDTTCVYSAAGTYGVNAWSVVILKQVK